jgi:hypothetical protein
MDDDEDDDEKVIWFLYLNIESLGILLLMN